MMLCQWSKYIAIINNNYRTTIPMKLRYRLIKTTQRLTFDILEQDMRFCGETDEEYLTHTAKNGIQIISRSRMDIQTDRLWLIGCKDNERSGTMVFSSDDKRDREFNRFQEALLDWAMFHPLFSENPSVGICELGDDIYELL